MSGINSISNNLGNIVVESKTNTSQVKNNTQTSTVSPATSLESTLTQSVKKGSAAVISFMDAPAKPEYTKESFKGNKLNIEFPQFTNLEDKNAQHNINLYFRTKAEDSFASALSSNGEKLTEEEIIIAAEEGDIMGGGENYESGVTDVSRTSNTLSVTTYDYTYSDGAAHGNSINNMTNFDLKTGNVLSLNDLFKKDSNYLEKISKFATGKLSQELGSDVLLKEGVSPQPENFKNFKISDNAIEFQFQTYQVAEFYGAGAPTVSIPLEVLENEIEPSSVLGDKINTNLKSAEYSGKINNKYGIDMNLKVDNANGKIHGAYKYSGKKDDINVSGKITSDGSFKMAESSNGVETGSFSGKFSSDKSIAKGTWVNSTGKKSMPFEIKIK